MNDTYCAGDRIQVGERSRADMALAKQPVLRLDQNTVLTLGAVKDEQVSLLDLVKGVIHFFSRAPRRLEVNTAFVNAGVRGTEGVIQVDDDSASVTVFEGEVLTENAQGSLRLSDGETAHAEGGGPPVARVVVRPRDAVQWALYYPPVTDLVDQERQGPEGWRELWRESVIAFRTGDVRAAFEALETIPEEARTVRWTIYRASLLLAVGRSDEASQLLEPLGQTHPGEADAFGLRSIIALVHGDKGKSQLLAQQATQANPGSASAWIAMSYSRQAEFDLEGALAAVAHATQLAPTHALAWARLAELHLGSARLDRAMEAADKAVALDPNLARTHSVLGFAHLARFETRKARTEFLRAIELDQADSLPRLGLGLTHIREGDLTQGRQDIEVAASLDPNQALIRSYLGKAYFDEKRDALAAKQFDIARMLDEKDPTPWFYGAVQEVTDNHPVEALHSMQQAIQRNDNRSVYRSRLLLDADLAARGTGLGRIYGELGFEQLARVEGWKSVNVDPTSFSSHRLLADTYSSLPRHEIARVSELLQSQLLQPLNLDPVQPRLSESNLVLIKALGPGAVAFNEFNELFAREQLVLHAGAQAGNRGADGEAALSGLFDNVAFSIGGFRFSSDGWRINSDQRDSLANAFVQVQPNPSTSFQFEVRYRHTRTGDVQQTFFQDDANEHLSNRTVTDTYRAGARHAFSPQSTVLVSLIYQNDERLANDPSNAPATVTIEEPSSHSVSGEIQHLYRSPRWTTILGGGYYKLDRSQITTLDDPNSFFFDRIEDDRGVHHSNIYLYANLNLLERVTFTLGSSADYYRSPGITKDEGSIFGFPFSSVTEAPLKVKQINPKLGMTWNPVAGTTLRAAAFKSFKRSLITNQTLEPTQVAGFNQFFDDIEGTRSRNWGVAVDQKLSGSLYVGAAHSRRSLTVPITLTDTAVTPPVSSVEYRAWRERDFNPYVFWTPSAKIALSAEYHDQQFKRSADAINFGLRDTTVRSLPLSARAFVSERFSIGAKATYVDQKGSFTHAGVCCEPGSSDFWLVDAGLNYRLPRRYGSIAVGVANMFDRQFRYQETDFNNPTILPIRAIFVRVSLALQ